MFLPVANDSRLQGLLYSLEGGESRQRDLCFMLSQDCRPSNVAQNKDPSARWALRAKEWVHFPSRPSGAYQKKGSQRAPPHLAQRGGQRRRDSFCRPSNVAQNKDPSARWALRAKEWVHFPSRPSGAYQKKGSQRAPPHLAQRGGQRRRDSFCRPSNVAQNKDPSAG